MFDRFVHDGVELVIGHDFQKVRHQLVLGSQTFIVLGRVGISLEAVLRSFDHFGEVGMGDRFLGCFERRFGAAAVVILERLIGVARRVWRAVL